MRIKRPYWTDVRGIGNSMPARAAILIPLVGYWIIFNDYFLQYTALSKALIPRALPLEQGHISLRLFATYFGLCAIALGSLLYQWRCPTEIKLYPTASDYVGGVFLSRIEEGRVTTALTSGDDESRKLLDKIEQSRKAGPSAATREEFDRRSDIARKNKLQAHFDLCNRRDPTARLLTATSYWVGFGLLTIPAIDIFLRVARAFIRSLT